VDVEAGEEAVRRIRDAVASTHGPEVLKGIGGFGGLFQPDLTGLAQPVLVSATDGVGTKLKVAVAAGIHDTVGIDNVAMNVNDILCQGARPLLFLDYIGVGSLEPGVVESIVAGVAEGCRQAGCALVGGEMAELPGIYSEGEYDLVGFAVGIADRDRLITGDAVDPGDVLIGLASSGLHSNGYSLARRVVFEAAGLTLADEMPGCGGTVADLLLEPTRIYVRAVLELMDEVTIKGLAHITGGGLPGNVGRALPEGTCAVIRGGAWEVPPIFRFLSEAGPVEQDEMLRTFNMGLGMVAVVDAEASGRALDGLARRGIPAWTIGAIEATEGPATVRVEGRVL
jgi:phosphoribosylformylglycinamidine cyclo-ligase